VLVLAVGKMSRSITEKLEKEGIEYSVEDLRLTPKE
ncbi:MAG TPA: transcriptional regulator, partial [Methanothermobacter thermautotrophicus]|nr:transcriptional regulator [Methanothermobacter thermautotrophicus]